MKVQVAAVVLKPKTERCNVTAVKTSLITIRGKTMKVILDPKELNSDMKMKLRWMLRRRATMCTTCSQDMLVRLSQGLTDRAVHQPDRMMKKQMMKTQNAEEPPDKSAK